MRFILFLFFILGVLNCQDLPNKVKVTTTTPEDFQKKIVKKKAVKRDLGAMQNCQSCHSQTRPLLPPKDSSRASTKARPSSQAKSFDASGIYPNIDRKHFQDGHAFPVLIEALEFEGLKATPRGKDLQDKTCLSCHNSHTDSERNSEIDLERRRENLGLWVSLEQIDGVLDVEVKFKSFNAAHRVPGGFASRAYVIVVDVVQNKEKLPLWFGPKLPKALRRKNVVAGIAMAKLFVDKNGNLSSNMTEAVDLLDDTRLEYKRFLGEHFIYALKKKSKVDVKATLYFLPRFPTWRGAVEVMQENADLIPKVRRN